MAWKLGPGIGFCETGGDLVFLDLARDKYLAMRGEDRAAFERLCRGEANDGEAMTRLVQTGLLVRSDSPVLIEPTRIEVPPRDLSSAAEQGFSIGAALSAAVSLRWARRAMRPDRIAATIAGFSRCERGETVEAPEERVEAIAARYAASRWIDPISQRCLIDALALGRIIRAQGGRAALVFGVRLAPFAAHCWLQTPRVVLTGTAADARNYAPILAVE